MLVPGTLIADGRYRLLALHGAGPSLQFWQGIDIALDRQVALTLVDPDRLLGDDGVREVLARTQRLSRIERPGLARVLDATTIADGTGLVVAEWIRGGSLREVADTQPSATGAARAIQSLAAAADAAHQAGVALSVDHPGRIRVSMNGDVVLAFPATLGTATPAEDVRGVGAALYALLTDRWPLPEAGSPSGLRPVALGPGGAPPEPRSLNPEIPFQISAAAARSVTPGGGISSTATLLNLLTRATAATERVTAAAGEAAVATRERPPIDPAEQAARRKRTLITGGVAGAAVLLVALLVLNSLVGRLFDDGGSELRGERLGLNTTAPPADASAGAEVKPVAATVFSPAGGADAPDLAGLAIDGDPDTKWPTDTYSDAVPFPNFKNGVGLMLQLPGPTVVGGVTVGVTGTGTQVQIRSADSASPATLEDTALLAGPTALRPGTNTIPVADAPQTSYLLVWISTLGQTAGLNRTDITEIGVRAAS